MKLKRREIERGWELRTERITIPTVMEIMKKEKISWEEAAKRAVIICGTAHKKKNIDCHRKLNGYSICDGCQKYRAKKKELDYLEWGMRSQPMPTQNKIVSKRR